MPTIVEIIKEYIELKQHGREYIGLCPFHSDTKPSLKVNPEKNLWKCFACGAGGSASHFVYEYCKLKGKPTKGIGSIKVDIVPTSVRLDDVKPITPILSYYEQPSFRHANHGVPNQTWQYTNEKGQPMFYVCRFNLKNGGKEVLPYTYCLYNGKARWTWRALKDNRPLYKLHRVVKSDDIVIVEGEKCADVGNANSDKYTFTTIQGGSKAWRLTDYSFLKGKNVILLRDNDEPGMECMSGIRSLILAHVGSVKQVKLPKDLPEKWDIADRVWKKGELDKFIDERI